MLVKYIGKKKNLILTRKELSKTYDFSKGVCTVEPIDAQILTVQYSQGFQLVDKPSPVKPITKVKSKTNVKIKAK